MIQYVLEPEKWEKARKTTCIVDSVTSKLQYEGYIDKGQKWKVDNIKRDSEISDIYPN